MTQGSGEREATEGRIEGRERWSGQQKAEVVLRLRAEDLVEVSREFRAPRLRGEGGSGQSVTLRRAATPIPHLSPARSSTGSARLPTIR
jgi:hypothetical protein